MSVLAKPQRGIELLIALNVDRIVYFLAIVGGLALGSYVGTFLLQDLAQ